MSRILGHKNTNIARVYLENLKYVEILEKSLKTSSLSNKYVKVIKADLDNKSVTLSQTDKVDKNSLV
ncbi:hypothetical protein CLPUN_41650 [Clostridium puniceum]|uniref:Uncharacterized protein n=1 Tax=Clostridium puniceum TaxID=29367 RepID=A0A1S8T997_9CLOT|nr:hypothetical protein CLPUN_41650 [Clostridium puniceum]